MQRLASEGTGQMRRAIAAPLAAMAVWTAAIAVDVWVGWQRRRRARITACALHQLSDRTLKDIGIDRSEIDSVAASVASDKPHWHDFDARRWC